MSRRTPERGEGKIGCIISLVVLAAASAAGVKIIPVYYSNNALSDAAQRKAETAVGRKEEDLLKELREEARKLEIQEALAAGAITLSKRSGTDVGNITITLNYSRKVDLYGITDITIPTNKKIEVALLENIR